MNKLCYRVIFNKPQGLPMATAETTTRPSQTSGTASALPGGRHPLFMAALKPLTFLVWGLLGMALIPVADAQIVADPSAPGNQRPTVLEAPNGVTLVNIQNATGNLLGNLNGNAALPDNQDEKSTTQSVISPANITITGTGNEEIDRQSEETVALLTSRDPETANQSLTNTLTLQQAQVLEEKIQKQRENQEAAQLVGGVLSGIVGDLATKYEWPDGSPQKLALHGLVGLIEAQIGDGSIAAGILGAVGQEALAPMMSAYLEEQGIAVGSDDYKALMQLGMTLAGAAAGALVDGTQGAATGASAAYEGVTNNYLKHDEAIRMAALKDRKLKGECDNACQQEIDSLTKIDQERNAQLDACQGVISDVCNQTRQDVRNAAAEYIRKETFALNNGTDTDLESVYARENRETRGYAEATMDDKASGWAAGAADFVFDTANALYNLAGTLGNAAIGDEQAQQALKDGAGAAWDYVKEPDNWPYLIGALTPEQKEDLAQAYERGDGYTVGQIMGNQALNIVSNLPSGGAAVGTIKIVKAADKIEDAASIAAKAQEAVKAAEKAAEAQKAAKIAAKDGAGAVTDANFAQSSIRLLTSQ
jgi:hypothetical protein